MGAPPAQNDNVNCTDFAFQEDAQFALKQDMSGPNNLDEDGDGVACEGLPKFTSTLPEGTLVCSSFDSQADAQAYLDAANPPGSRKHMDRDRDGIVCEEFDYSEPRPEPQPGMPDTGAGGLTTGTGIPVGNAAAGLVVLLVAGVAAALAAGITWNSGAQVGTRRLALSAASLGVFGLLLWLLGPSLGLS